MPGPGSGDSSDDFGHREDSDGRSETSPVDAAETSDPDYDEERDTDDVNRDGESTANDAEPTAATDGSTSDRPDVRTTGSNDVSIEEDGLIRWFLNTDDGPIVVIRDVASSVAVVALIGLILFGVSGIWPPLVAVESGSMEPNMYRGDLVFVVNEDRFVGDDPTAGTGIVTRRTGAENGHEKFDRPGDVIVFKPDGSEISTPVIHRAHFWVDEGENWVDTKANPNHLNGATCDEIRDCPAPHDGFVTKGDNNDAYDQTNRGARTTVVKPGWVTGKGMFRIPWLGHVRLTFDSLFGAMIPPGANTGFEPGASPTSPVAATGTNPGPTSEFAPITDRPSLFEWPADGPDFAVGTAGIVATAVLLRRRVGG